MKLKTALTASVAGAALFALGAPMVASNAHAGISNGNKNSLTVSGQIVRSILYADDGHTSDVFQLDGGTTSSRFRLVTKAQMNESTTVGGIIEMNIPQPNKFSDAHLGDPNITGTARVANGSLSTRKADISVSHKQFGTVSFGKGDPFTNGATELGQGFGPVAYGVNDVPEAAGFKFYNSTTSAYSSVAASSVFNSFDMISRSVRVGYETPSFAGFKVGTDWIDGSGGDVGAKYSGKFGAFSVDAALGYVAEGGLSTTIDHRIGGSIDIEHDSGLGVAATYIHQGNVSGATQGSSSKGYGAGVSYAAHLYSAGSTHFGVAYYETKDTVSSGDKGKRWRVTASQNFDSVGMDAGLMYSHMSYDDNTSASYDNISTVLFSTRLKF